MGQFSAACEDFGLTNKKTTKTQARGKVVASTSIANHELEAVREFVYLVSTISDNLSLEVELKRLIGKAATTLSMLSKRV